MKETHGSEGKRKQAVECSTERGVKEGSGEGNEGKEANGKRGESEGAVGAR